MQKLVCFCYTKIIYHDKSVVLKSITEEMTDKTCFVITHRRSMLKYCDRVIELDEDGNITVKPISEYNI